MLLAAAPHIRLANVAGARVPRFAIVPDLTLPVITTLPST
jgi:hypothetical protein